MKIMNENFQDFSQDGDIGRYTLPPWTTKRRTTTNLKTKNNPNCQNIELYGSLTTKELKKKHSSRLVGGEIGSCGREDAWERSGWRTGSPGIPHLLADKWDKPGGTNGEWDRPHNPGFQHGKLKTQNLCL